MINREFKDFSMNFDFHPSTKDLVRLYDDKAIIQSVKNLIFTNYYERPFQPWIGSGVTGVLFENVSSLTSFSLQMMIFNILKQHEPRVTVDLKDIIVVDAIDNNAIGVEINIHINKLKKDVVAELSLDRIR